MDETFFTVRLYTDTFRPFPDFQARREQLPDHKEWDLASGTCCFFLSA